MIAADGSYDYTPDANYNGADSFTYTVTDADSGEQLTRTVNITVNSVADLTAGNDSNAGNEDTVISGSVAGNNSTTSGGTLAYALDSDGSHGNAVIAADGSYDYTPDANYNGADSFTYTVTDADSGEQLTRTVNITVNSVADLTAGNDSNAGNEDTVISGSVAGNNSTTSGGTLAYALDSDGSHGNAVIAADGSYDYTPDANYNGADSFTYTVTDADSGEQLTRTVNITVNSVADLTAGNDSNAGNEDTVISGSVAGNNSTTSGGTLAYALDSDGSHGNAVIAADGSYDYTPDANYNGADSFTYTVTDADSGEQLTRTVNITVNSVADLTAGNDSNAGNEDTVISGSVAGNNSTTSGGTLAYALDSDGSHGNAVIAADGSYDYTPDANYNGADSFTYTVTDADSGEQLTRTVNITVNSVADLTAGNDSNAGNEDTVISGSVAGNNSTTSGGTLAYALDSDGSHGNAVIAADGSYDYTPDANYNGADSFTYTVTDADSGEQLTRTVNITVNSVADLTAGNDSNAGNEDTVISGSVAGNNSTTSGGTLAYALDSDGSHGNAVIAADGSYDYTPDANYNGADSFTYTVTDADSGEQLTRTVNITVNSVADLTAGNDSNAGNEDTVISGSVAGNNSTTSGGTLAYALDSDGSHGNAVIAADGSYDYTPDANYNGADSFTYTVTDADSGEQLTRTVNITVNSVADLTAGNDSNAGNEDTVISGSVAGNNSTTSGGTLAYALDSDGSHGNAVIAADGSYDYTPDANYNGADSFTYTVTDADSGEQLTRTVNITVNSVADLTAGNDSNAGNEDTVISGSVAGNNSTTSGGTLAYALDSDGSHGNAVIAADGSYDYTPDANYNGADSFTYTVTDSDSGEQLTRTVNITVNSVADLTAGNDSNAGNEDTVISGSVAGNNSTTSGGTLAYALDSDGSHGNAVIAADGSYDYTPDANYNGADSFTYTVTDADSGEQLTRTVNITVNSVADLTAGNDSNAGNEDTVISGSVAGNNSTTSGGTLAYALDSDGSHGNAVIAADGSYDYTPDANYNGADSFTYTVTDADSGEQLTRTVNITVTPVNDAPIIVDATAAAISENSSNGTAVYNVNDSLTMTDSDRDGDDITYSITGGNTSGAFAINAGTGEITVVNSAALDFEANPSFTLTVSASDGSLADTAAVTINLTDQNEAPPPPPVSNDPDPNDFDLLLGTGTTLEGTNNGEVLTVSNLGNKIDIINAFGGNDTITTGNGADKVYAGDGDDFIYGQSGADLLYGQPGIDTIKGDEDADTIYGGSGNDIIEGNSGVDTIYGGSGSDTIHGGQDNDLIIGGYGADHLWGDAGSDTFKYLSGKDTGDTIHDFLPGTDVINLLGLGVTSATQNSDVVAHGATWTADGTATLVSVDLDGNIANGVELQIELTGVNPNTLTSASFVF